MTTRNNRRSQRLWKSSWIMLGTGVLIFGLALIPLLSKTNFSFAASSHSISATSRQPIVNGTTFSINGQILTVHMRTHGTTKTVNVTTGANPTQIATATFNTSSHIMAINGLNQVSNIIHLTHNSVAQLRQLLIHQQITFAQGVPSVANAQANPNTVSGKDFWFMDGFQFVTQSASPNVRPGFPWSIQVHTGGIPGKLQTLKTLEGPPTAGDLGKFQATVTSLKTAEIATAISAGTGAISTIIAIITASTGIGTLVAALTAVGAFLRTAQDAISVFTQQKTLQATFQRLVAEAKMIPAPATPAQPTTPQPAQPTTGLPGGQTICGITSVCG